MYELLTRYQGVTHIMKAVRIVIFFYKHFAAWWLFKLGGKSVYCSVLLYFILVGPLLLLGTEREQDWGTGEHIDNECQKQNFEC